MITELWSTPVWQIQVSNYELIVKELFDAQGRLPHRQEGRFLDVRKYFDPASCLPHFMDRIVGWANEIVSQYEGGEMEILRAWFNYQRFGEAKYPHVHHGSRLAAVFYMTAPSYCGDLLLLDPRGGVQGWDKNELIYHRIAPKPGMLVMFPAYVQHVTEENRNRDPRVSFVANIGESA